MPKLNAKLTVFTGSMFASKSSALISQGERHSIAGHNVVYVKPFSDTRVLDGSIADGLYTHSGRGVEAVTLQESTYLLNAKTWIAINLADVILFDEVQFYEGKIVDIIQELLSKGKVVYVAGLDMDYKGKHFNVTANLMGIADDVHKLKAVCYSCGEDSYVTAKVGGTDDRLQLGSKDIYQPLCRNCYTEHNTTKTMEEEVTV